MGETIYSRDKRDYIGAFNTEQEALTAAQKYAEDLNQHMYELIKDENRAAEFKCVHCGQTTFTLTRQCSSSKDKKHEFENTYRTVYYHT